MPDCQVLVVGAGPTGLVTALWLARRGVRVRIVDRTDAPGTTSRAIVLHARSLELLRQLGVADDVVGGGIVVDHLAMVASGRRVAHVRLGEFGRGLSPYPFVLSFPQDDLERVLIRHLQDAGVRVERRTELVGLIDEGDGVRARLRTSTGEHLVRASYVAGCDGAGSTVRHEVGLRFPGGTYAEVFYVADVVLTGPAPGVAIEIRLDADGFCLVLPVRRTGSYRLIGLVPQALASEEGLTFDDVAADVARKTGLTIAGVNWFSTYKVHHRVAERFRVGRVLLAGDAAHVHSPAGGQGMNTGIGDAAGVAWRLVDVLEGADPALLDTYEPERIAFARRLVATTDRMFRLLATRSRAGAAFRTVVLPPLLAALTRSPLTSRAMFRAVSQLGVTYRGSALSQGVASRVHGGDRLPWVEGTDNLQPLGSLDWQIHVHGDATRALWAVASEIGVPVHTCTWTAAAGRAGIARGALHLVRPDGYVALVARQDDDGLAELRRYVATWGVGRRDVVGV